MKTTLVKWLTTLSEKSLKLAERLVPKIGPAPKPYAALTPTSSISEDDGKQYFEALKWALQSNEIKNIALTGPYGSGKSSILLSFQKNFPEHNFLNISLATFGKALPNHGEGLTNEKDNDVIDHLQIEQSILQQIFYKKKQNAIPDTRFSRRSALTTKRLSFYTFLVAIWLLSICYLMNIGFSRQPEILNDLLSKFDKGLDFISYTIVILGITKVLYEAIRTTRNITFQKLKFSANNIEIEAEKGKSPLNENFDELLYFFEATGYHGLIIEDLDRFQSTDIFSKLRELNLLLNSSEQIKRKPIVFIYGIKDDLFVVGDRTKFFDFIIPVVPVVSSSNAGDRLYQMFAEAGLSANLPQAHVFRIGSYVTDMRMVKNIFNEYIMYRDKIGIEAEDKLLGIITYKNIYPKDFSDLHSGAGIIYRTFGGKEEAVAQIGAELNLEIETIEASVKKLEAEIAQNITELNTIYIAKMRERLPTLTRFYVNGAQFTPAEIIQEANFNLLINSNGIQYIPDYGSAHNSGIKFLTIENEVDSIKTYADRYKIIKEKESIDLGNLKSDLTRKQVQKEQLYALSLRELLLTYDVSLFEKDLNKHDLLVYLLKYGAIDEQYQLYISNFYEGVLRKNDQLFLIAVKNRQAKAPDLQISNCSEIIKRLQVDDFRSHAVLNVHLVEYLLERKAQHRIFLKPILDQLIDGTEQSWNFLEFYRNKTSDQIGPFINFICSSWPDFWQRVMGRFKERDKDLISIFVTILNACSIDELNALNKEKTVDSYLQDNYFEISSAVAGDGESKIQSLIQSSGVKIRRLEGPTKLPALQFLVKNNHYELTKENIFFILSRFSARAFQLVQKNDYFTFSDIMQSECTELIEYFYKDINFGIELLLANPHNREEESGEALKLLNDAVLALEVKMKFIESIRFSLPDLSVVNIETENKDADIGLPQLLLRHHRVTPSWHNVAYYFSQFEFDTSLVGYLNNAQSYEALSKQTISEGVVEAEVLKSLTDYIYATSDISELAFSKLHLCLPEVQSAVFAKVPKGRLLYLIDERKIPFTQVNLDILTERSDDVVDHFLQSNFPKIGDSDDQIKYQPQHVRYVLGQPSLNESKALNIIDSLTPDILATEDALSMDIADLIIDHRLREVKVSAIDEIFRSTITDDKKVQLFKELMKNMAYQDLSPNFPRLGQSYKQLSQGVEQFEEGVIDLSILEYLQQNKFISGYQINEGHLEISYSE